MEHWTAAWSELLDWTARLNYWTTWTHVYLPTYFEHIAKSLRS